MDKLAKLIRKRLRTDRDLVVIVSGDEGEGKSRFVVELCKMIDPKFTIERNVAYRGGEIKGKYETLPKYSVLDIDEAMKDFYKRGWMTVDRRKLNILFSRIREKNIATFMLIPNFWDIDPYYRNHRVKIWIHIASRGIVVVSKKDKNPYALDKWHQKENEKIIGRFLYKRVDSIDNLVHAMSKTKNFIYNLNFIPKDEQLWQEYLKKKGEYVEQEEKDDALEEKQRQSQTEQRLWLQTGVMLIYLKKLGAMRKEIVGIMRGYGVPFNEHLIPKLINRATEHKRAKYQEKLDSNLNISQRVDLKPNKE